MAMLNNQIVLAIWEKVEEGPQDSRAFHQKYHVETKRECPALMSMFVSKSRIYMDIPGYVICIYIYMYDK